MDRAQQGGVPWRTAFEWLAPGHHLGLFTNSEQELNAVLAAFLRTGLERGQRCLYFAPEDRLMKLQRAVPPQELDLKTAVASGALKAAARPRNADRLSRLLREAAQAAREAQTGLRVALEMRDGEAKLEDLIARERALVRVLSEQSCLVLCLYDRRRFPARSLLAALYCHPLVIHAGMLCQNFHYRPPENLLWPDRELEWLLKNICERERFFQALAGQASAPAAPEAVRLPPAGCQDCLHRLAALEQMYRQKQQLEAVGELAGQLAAEFNTHLTVIMGYAQMLASAPQTPPACREYAQEILKASQRTAALTERMMAFSRRQRPRPARLELNATLEKLEQRPPA